MKLEENKKAPLAFPADFWYSVPGVNAMALEFQALAPEHDAALAALIRRSLEAHDLALPGTAYFDAGLDHLSDYYAALPDRRAYFVLLDGGRLAGGIGLAECGLFEGCAELQKLYLDAGMQGRGLGYRLIEKAEDAARALGYRQMYLETHTNLAAAIHIYEKSGYVRIDKPDAVVHGTMNRFYLKTMNAVRRF